jgi:site-specific DNA-methyltransferase (adenine-specific)
MNHRLIHGDCLDVLDSLPKATCIFADPPDNIGLKYPDYSDKIPDKDYLDWLYECLDLFVMKADIVWVSHNAKWNLALGEAICELLREYKWLEARQCIQTFTFGQHRQTDFGNNYRPLLRLSRDDATFYPDQIRVPSWRQKNGDKRADPRGRVPGDVFDFPRVTGNSRQRRSWCPTQLHEGLIERCIRFSTPDPGYGINLNEKATVIDPFAGTGTTLRVCKSIGRQCTLIESSKTYCSELAKEHGLEIERPAMRRAA